MKTYTSQYSSRHNRRTRRILEMYHTGKCIRRFAGNYAYCRYFKDRKWYILVLILYIKHAMCLKDYRIRSFVSIWHAHGDLCKHLEIDSSTGLDDWYSIYS